MGKAKSLMTTSSGVYYPPSVIGSPNENEWYVLLAELSYGFYECVRCGAVIRAGNTRRHTMAVHS